MRFILLGLLLSACSFVSTQPYKLIILHTNDIHSHLEPFCAQECLGGMAKVISFIEEQKKQNPNLILLDAGDRFTGTVFHTIHKGEDMAVLMNQVDYTAMIFGNHEFDDGVQTLERFVEMSSAPMIASNIVFEQNSVLSKHVLSMKIIENQGRKIGLIGVTTPETTVSSISGGLVDFLPVEQVVKDKVSELKYKGVDIVIVISHNDFEQDIELAKNVAGIDVIVGGHSHLLLPKEDYPTSIIGPDGKTVLVVTAGKAGQYVGALNVSFDGSGNVTAFEGRAVPMDASIPQDEQAKKYIAGIASEIQEITEQKIFTLTAPLPLSSGKECKEECLLAEVLTDALRKSFDGVDIVLINSGAFRSPLPKGDITYAQFVSAFPFDNKAVIVSLSGTQISTMLQTALNSSFSALLQPSGLRYKIKNKTVEQIEVLEKEMYVPIDPNKKYAVLINDFIAKGGDGIVTLKQSYTLGKDFRTQLIAFFSKQKKITPQLSKKIILAF